MGKESPSSQPSQVNPMSPTLEHPRMDPPPPYDTVTRSSTSSSVRSVDRLNPDGTGPSQTQQPQTQSPPAPMHVTEGPGRIAAEPKDKKYSQDGGCCNYGNNVNGCMNYGDGSDGCMNYESRAGCMNYHSTGGCLNYEVDGDWEGNEGCLSYRRGGGCCLFGDR